jgi:hypothetical protein
MDAAAPRSNLWGAAAGILASRAATLPFEAAPAGQSIHASFAQERLLMLAAFEPIPSVYNVSLAWWVEGSLPVPLLQSALDKLAEAHEALRMYFRMGFGTPEIMVSEGPDTKCALQILQAISRESARDLASAELKKEFDLGKGPLWRAVLIQVDPATELLLLIFHQTIVDGTSLRLLGRDFARLYQSGSAAPHEDRGLRDFAAWQRNAWQMVDAKAPEARFWQGILEKPVRQLYLPTLVPGMRSGETGPVLQEEFRVSPEVAEGLHRLSRAARVSNFVTMLSALGILLDRFSPRGGGDAAATVSVFVTSAARYRPELLRMVGLLANILPFRLDMSGDPTIGTVLERVHEYSTVAYANQSLPFEHMLRWLRLEGGSPGATPVQVQFLFNNSEIPLLVLPGVGRLVPAHEVSTHVQKPPLVLEVAEVRDGFVGRWRARLDLFDAGVVREINEKWQALLAELGSTGTR